MMGIWGATDWREVIGRISSHRAIAPSFAVLVSLLCVRGVFTVSNVFYYRDLALYYWPYHQWFRRTVQAGQSPIWDPNPGGGYPTLGDAALQMVFPPTLLLKALPEIVGFNLSIALPFPIAALGMFLFARRYATRWASAVAAIAYAASGPILSTGCLSNIAWCVAIVPFVFWTVAGIASQPSARRFGLLALLFSLELMAGEPVTLVGTAVMATVFAALGAPAAGSTLACRARSTALTVGAGLTGALLSAVQAIPLIDQASRSIRGLGQTTEIWSLHPLRLAETVLPFVFGNTLGLQEETSPWLFVLNSGREPYLASIYVGALALILAVAGVASEPLRGRAILWCAFIFATLICAFGSNTAVYPALQELVPALSIFRYPEKFSYLAMLPMAALVAAGWDGLTISSRGRRAAIAGAVALVLGFAASCVIAMSGGQPDAAHALAGLAGDSDPSGSTHWLLGSIVAALPRLLVLLVAASALAFHGHQSGSRSLVIRAAAVAVLSIDLILANGGLNPTIDASLLGKPDWIAATTPHRADRVHVPLSFVKVEGRQDVDSPPGKEIPPGVTPPAYAAVRGTVLCSYPAAFNVRQSLSSNVTRMRPREYMTLVGQFSNAERSLQYRFLRLIGTRYALVATPPPPPSHELMTVPQLAPLALYELGDLGSRVRVMTSSTIEPDTDRAVAALFNPFTLPTSAVVVAAESPAAGNPGETAPADAEILDETTTSVLVRASAPDNGGHLVLFDSFDPGWSATVDGEPAAVVRAWGVYRAVRLAPGVHTVEFRYVSNPFRIGLLISLATGLVLLVIALRRPRHATEAINGDAS